MLEQSLLSVDEADTFVFFLCPDFPMVPVAAAIEVLEAANIVLGRNYYKWNFASIDGKPVAAANGISTNAATSLGDLRKIILTGSKPKAVIVSSGIDVQTYENKSLFATLRETARQRIRVGAISTGSHLLAAAGLLNERFCVVHWEILEDFRQRFPDVYVKSDLYEIDDQFCTCAGGLSAMDMMLALIGNDHPKNVLQLICSRLHIDRIRSPNQKQRLLKSGVNTSDVLLTAVIDLMEKNIADPLSMEEISNLVGCSRRQVERKFQLELKISPALFYLKTRLRYADYLLRSSSKPMTQVSAEAGFSYFSHFSRAYKANYGTSPKEARNGKQHAIQD